MAWGLSPDFIGNRGKTFPLDLLLSHPRFSDLPTALIYDSFSSPIHSDNVRDENRFCSRDLFYDGIQYVFKVS